MLTELVVTSFSVSVFDRLSFNSILLSTISKIWLGFAWDVMYCMLECVTIPRLDFLSPTTRSIPGVFQQLHNFNIAQTGCVYSTLV